MMAKRIIIYCIGVLFMAAGFIFNAKSGLGTTPICSIAYCVSVLTGTTFSDMTMILFALCFFAAILIRWKKPHWTDFLQLPYCFIFTRCMSAFAAILPSPTELPLQILFLVLGIVCVGTGATMTLAMHLVPNPGDYMVNCFGNRIHKSLGFAKNVVDVVIVGSVCIISLITHRGILELGVGFGTLAAVILTGRWMALVNHFFLNKYNQVYKSAYIKIFDNKDDEAVAA